MMVRRQTFVDVLVAEHDGILDVCERGGREPTPDESLRLAAIRDEMKAVAASRRREHK